MGKCPKCGEKAVHVVVAEDEKGRAIDIGEYCEKCDYEQKY